MTLPTFLRGFSAGVLVLLVAGTLPGANATPQLPPRLDSDLLRGRSPRAIVLFDHDVSAAEIRRLAGAGVTHARVFDAIDAVAVRGPRRSYFDIARWPDVLWVDDDNRIQFHNEVAKQDTRVDRVREGARPLESQYTGKGVTVAVIDSGVDTTHPDLVDRLTANLDMAPAELLDPITDGEYSERDAERSVGTDEIGHGTHVAGIVGGDARSAEGADLTGVAPNATLINCRLGTFPSETSALACYQWLLDHRSDSRFPGGIRVATNSWGLRGDLKGKRPLTMMLKKAVQARISVVFSAGNEGKPGRSETSTVVRYPNSMEQVITVGATCKSRGSRSDQCRSGRVWRSSSRGPEIDVVAPGVDIWSTRAAASVLHVTALLLGSHQMPGSPDPIAMANNHALYANMSGTSQAAPHVAGVVALMLEANPHLTPAEIEKILVETAADRGKRGFDENYGFGLVDALAAVSTAERR